MGALKTDSPSKMEVTCAKPSSTPNKISDLATESQKSNELNASESLNAESMETDNATESRCDSDKSKSTITKSSNNDDTQD